MEYVAFLFLGVGILLVMAGVLLQVNEKNRAAASSRRPLDEYLARPALAVSPLAEQPVVPAVQAPAAAPVAASVPGPFQFVDSVPAPMVAAAAPAPVAVNVQKSNPRLFEKFAYLYLDASERNVYEGNGAAPTFDFAEVSGISRFGRGVFSYDGFGFYFDHSTGQERFPLQNLKSVGFYPNCIALTFRTKQPVALLFMEETETIRKILETFRVPQHAGV